MLIVQTISTFGGKGLYVSLPGRSTLALTNYICLFVFMTKVIGQNCQKKVDDLFLSLTQYVSCFYS